MTGADDLVCERLPLRIPERDQEADVANRTGIATPMGFSGSFGHEGADSIRRSVPVSGDVYHANKLASRIGGQNGSPPEVTVSFRMCCQQVIQHPSAT